MQRASSHTRMQPPRPMGSPGTAAKPSQGMGDKSVSLPSLFPNAAYTGAGRGYPALPGGIPGGEKSLKRSPSQLLLDRQDLGLLYSRDVKPKITGFLDLAEFSSQTKTSVAVDQPLFSVYPPVIAFVDFEGLQTYETTVTLRNQDTVARRVKVCPPDSPFFELAAVRSPARMRGAATSGGANTATDKVAPGMEVQYIVRFKPDARIDYTYDLVVVTEREKFSVPIRASGGSALLDFPDVIDFGDECIVGHKNERTVLVRNLGDRATKLMCRTAPPFSVLVPEGYLAEGAACQVSVFFTPITAERAECEIHLKYGEMEAVGLLRGGASNAEVSLSHTLLMVEDTYVGLESQGVVTIRNDSAVPVDFSWRLFPSMDEELQHRFALQRQLKTEEMDEMLFMQQANLSEDSEESGSEDSDTERVRARREGKVTRQLSRKYDNILKAVNEDPMLFRDAIFSINPLNGCIWPKSQITCACSFGPKDALIYSATAYLSAVGQEERAPLVIKGRGIGPKATFSYDELDVGNVFVESAHRYEVQLLNQGDIEVDFRLKPRDTEFARRFKFQPDHGTIAVGGQCEIVVDFTPKKLAEFHEIFEWSLKGSATAVTLAFRGTSVEPTFEFDTDKLNFGTVSFGFLNSRMLTLTNTSEVPCVYNLRIPGDDFGEFEIIPSRGTLLPSCAQRVQVDFISKTEKKYDVKLSVDLENVGEELRSIPIVAQCAVPQVSFEPHGTLDYGDVFIRYPFHQSLYLHNTSMLPAKFEVEPQEDKSRAEFEPDQWTGTVPPCASHVITVTLTAQTPGPLRIPMYVKIHGRDVPFPLVLVGTSVGPRVLVDPPSLDWGSVKCLEPVTRHVRLTNSSCIDASVRAFMNDRKSLWTVHPKVIHLSPQETLQLAVTLRIDETRKETDTLNLIVCEGEDLMVGLSGRGDGTPIKCEEEIEFIDFGTLFTTHTEPKEIIIKNYGQQARRLTWGRDKDKEKKKDKERKDKEAQEAQSGGKKKKKAEAVEAPPIFRVEPEMVVLEPKSAYRFTFLASSATPGVVMDELICTETLDKGGGVGKMIFKTNLKATIVAPQLKLSHSKLSFEYLWDKNRPVSPMTDSLRLENTGPLEVRFKVEITYPFACDLDEGVIPPGGTQELQIDFDPGYKADKKSGTIKNKMSIGYDEHPAVNVVELVGKVVWPNIELDIAKLDFGTVLNDTSRKLEVRMTNPTVLQVAYHWCFALSGGRQSDEASNPRTPAAALPSPMMDSKSSNIQARTTGNSGMNSQGVTFTDDSGGSPAGTASGWALGASPGSVSSEIGASQDLAELNQVFDILPIFGKLEPGETQVATFTYDGMRDRSFKAIAVCMVDGGPEYEVSLRGNAAPCKYSLDKNELDFNDIPFTEVGEQELFLANRGQVPANFNFNMSGVSRSFVVDIVPSHGIMKPEEKLKVIVRFRAGIPDLVEEKVLVEVAHFEPQVLIVRGQGTFPGIVLNLPRKDEFEHRANLEAAALRTAAQKLALEDTSGTMETMEAANPISPRQAGRAATSPSHTRRGKLDDGEPPSPRSAATEGNLAGMASMKDTQQSLAMTKMSTMRGPDIPDLELEVEVDRHYLCEVLLNGPGVTPPTPGAPERPQLTRSNSMSPSKKSKAGKKDLIEQPTVTAAYYVCDFGHIPLGNVCKRTVDVYNTCSEPVTLTIDKKALKEMGFLIEPENIKPVQPGKALKLEVSATRAKEESETTVELEWNLPVKGGPNYKVKLVADWVLPELVLSSESIDFGRIIIGQRKRVIVEFHNEKKVPVDWVFAKPKDKYGQDLSPNELVFDLSPAAGVVMPGEKQYATAIFSPQAAQAYTSVLHLRIRDNQKRKSINVVGRGDVMRLDVRPSLSYNLGPIMPKNSGCSTEFWLCNPTDYPIEVYSLDFDQKYLDEERALADFDGFETGFCEMPVRQPGDGIWKAVASRVLDVRAEKEAEAAAKLSLQNTQGAQGVTEGEPTAEGTALLALKAAAQEKDEEVMDGSPYPYRVPDGKRVNAIIAGPPKSGMSTLALRLSKEDKRKVITSIDEIFTWAAEHDGFLHSDWAARSIVKRIKEGNVPSMSEAAHLLRRRVELPDCNAGVIIDGLQSDFLDAEQVTDAVLEAFSGDKVVLMTVALPAPEVQEEEDLSVAAPPDFSEPQADNPDPAAPVKPPPPSLAGSAMSKLYEELQTALLAHIEELKAAMPEMEAAKKGAEEALTEAGARAEAVAASKTAAAAEAAAAAAEAAAAAGLSPLDPSSAEYPAEAFDGEVDSETAEVLAAKAEAEKLVFGATAAIAEAQADLASCEASVGWKPPEVPVDPAVAAAAAAEAAAAPKAKAKAAPAKGAPPPVEVAEPTEPVADPAVEQLVKLYNEQRTAALTVVERCNTRARSEEEERQRDQDRRKVSRKAAQLAASVAKRGQSTGSRNAPPPEVEPVVDFEPKMDKYLPPADVLTLELTPAPFDLLLEPSREALPLPLIPANSPLPLSTIRQIVSLPNARPERSPPVNFSILTPVPAVSNPIRIASRAGSKASAPDANAEGSQDQEETPKEVTVADQTRWIIEPQSEQRLLVHFDSEEVASYSTVLQFEVVGDVASAPTTIGVSGVAALPGINSDPRLIFSRRKKKRPEAGYAVKAFVTSLGVYDFGPLLAGRDPSSRNPAPVVPTDEAGDEVVADPVEARGAEGAGDSGVDSDGQEMNQDPIPPREMTAVSTHVMRHAESIRITNDSLFPANVRLGLASSGGDFETPPQEGQEPQEHADEVTKGPSSFIIEPENIRLGVGEQADVKIWCFPPDKGLYKDRFVARIEHNPEPVVFKLCALGAVPAISVDNQNVDFGRLMMNIRAEDQKVRVKNDSAVPVRWQLLCSDSKVVEADPPADKEPPEEGHEPKMPDEFMLDPKEGLLSPGEVRDVRISFRATRPASFKFGLRLEARDAEGLNGWQEAGKVAVGAETFAVDAVVEPDPREVALDFGTVLVHTSAQRTFDIVNRGRFPVRFELAVRRALRELLAINQHKDELQPGERRTITATCTPGRVFEASGERDGIALQIFDTLSGESVDHRIPPIRVGVTAVYNTFQVTPPRGLNFGPVEKGETQTRTFTVRNNGIFAFDWCLFNYADLPTFGEDGKPPPPPACVNAGPFAVKPTSGKLQPDEDVQVNVTFEAQGDEDYDSKIAVWVDGVQGENDGRPLTAGQPVAGTSTYLLTGQSCVPGINTVDLQTVFEEQFFASTLEDAIAIAGRADVRVFSEADQIFHFGPVLASGGAGVAASTPASPSRAFTAELTQPGVTEFLRLSNPKAIPCKIQLHIKPREGGDTKAGNEIVFEVEPQELVIPPHESRQIAVSFKPTHLANFGAVLEAVVPQGTDPNTNYLSFELRGDGAVPSISLQGPRLFGDEGGELVMGKLTLGKTHEVRMTLRNGGLLPATARVECMRSEHFTVTCASTVALNKGEQRTFQVRFHPRSVGKVQTDLRIRTLGNPFEDVVIQLKGEGHSAEVCWDLAEARLPPIRTSAAVVEDSAHAPAPDELELREVAVGQEISVTFQLNNGSKQPLRFAFPEQMPEPFGQQLQVEPRTGFIDPQSKQAITLIFRPTDKLQASGVYVPCNMVNVTFAEESPAEGDVATEPPVEPQYQVIEGTQLELPLMVSAVADTPAIECDVEEINFLPTLMLGSKVWRFMIKNPSIISIPFEWKMQGRNSSAYTVSPMHGRVAAQGEQEIEVHFAPMEVENFDCQLLCSSQMITAKPVLRLPVTGTALRPWCHFELPGSDYRSRRQSNAPLDPKYQIVEIVSLGTHVKNTKRFYVSNPTAEPIDFLWQQEQPVFSSARPESADDDAFKCLIRKGTILPSKKFEMTFEFSPQNSNTKESFWSFVLLGPKVEEHFLIAGTVKEPRVGMDMACINFGERLLSGMASETVRLVNKEHIPFSFQIDPASFQQEGQLQALSISPMSGVVGPDSDISITVHFKPMEELPFNFNVVCNIKRKKEPVVLNVKGIGYKIHASLAIEEPSGRRLINSGVTEVLDMGLLQVHEQRELTLYLKNDSKRNFNFRVQMLMGANRRPKPIGAFERPPYISISNTQGVAPHHEETVIGFKYCPRDAHMLEGSILQVAIPAGPVEETFSIALTGGAKRSRVDFSFLSHDFGPCFIARGGATMAGEPFSQTEDTKYERVCIVATNRDDSDCLISTTFQREPWLDVQLNSAMIEAGGSLRIPIVFSPREVCEYMQRIEFVVNDYTRMHVDVRGRGCPLKLELTDSDMQNIDFGITRGNEPVSRTVRLINRSPRPVTFELGDEKGELAERSVTWTPGHPTTLRPRETADVELRFMPTYRIAPFRLPLIAKCEHGVEVRLLHIAGTCHATEMRLSEHSVFFGDVVVGSQATRTVRLHNFGDLGAKFRFEIGAKYSKIFSVTPSEGFVRPSEDILLTLAFHPTYERIQEFKRADGKKRGGKTPGADAKAGLDVGITVRDIRCILDGHEPLMLEASGKCVVQPGETKSLEFTTEVRTKTQNSFLLENTTDSDWKVQPQVATQEPAGTNYFSCEREIIVPAGKSVPVQVYYMPLTMTGAEEESVSPSHGKRCIVHKGTVFVGTPDGNAVGYSLEGTASAPKVRDRMEVEVPCKKKHTQAVPVKNWLHERQRFDVKVELVEPAPGTPQSQGINLQGVGTLDLPPGLEREYKFSVYAYHEGSALVRVNLRSQETGEFMMLEVALKFFAAESLATINLQAACRQMARHKIAVANPLQQTARFTCVSSLSCIRSSPEQLEVPPRSEKTIELLFRPLEEGDGEAEVTLKSEELGTYPYTVAWKATPAGMERALVLKAPLGGSVVEKFKFLHYARQPVTYRAIVEGAPGQKGPSVDFLLEASEVTAPACSSGEPIPVEMGVRFQPSMLGECRGMLAIQGAGGGEYKAMLTGFAQPPQPQGPILVLNGKQGIVEFRNPFDKATEFSLQVDNPAFTVAMRSQKIDAQKAVQISVNFKSDRPQGGRLIISCDKVSTPWIFFLKGEL